MCALKPGLAVAGKQARRLDLQRPALGGAAADRLDDLARVGAGFLGEDHQLAHRHHLRGSHDLVGSLGDLPGARLADMRNRLAHGLKYGHHPFQGFGWATHHDRQRPLDRPNFAAADRRIQAQDALLPQHSGDMARRRRA